MSKNRGSSVIRRLEAGLLAVGTLWVAVVTAGSETVGGAVEALREAAPVGVLRWELGDLWERDGLSAAAALTIGESALLAAARGEVVELWSLERQEIAEEDGETPEPVSTPVEETPLDGPGEAVDNGVAAKTLVPSDPDGYLIAGRVYVSNSTKHSPSAEAVCGAFSARLSEDEPQILIVHTHGSEAYTPVPGTDIVWSGDYRTTDYRFNVVKAGDEMAAVFGEAGISVLHDRTLYDYPSYSGAYDRSLASIERYLEKYPSISFVLDVHRDAIEDTQGNQYKVVSEIDGVGVAAQMSLVIGSDGSGLSHPDWMENLKLAAAIQEEALARYPTLMRPVLLRNSRYNQHATKGSLLVEVGAAGNSLDEALLAAKLFAEGFADTILPTKSS